MVTTSERSTRQIHDIASLYPLHQTQPLQVWEGLRVEYVDDIMLELDKDVLINTTDGNSLVGLEVAQAGDTKAKIKGGKGEEDKHPISNSLTPASTPSTHLDPPKQQLVETSSTNGTPSADHDLPRIFTSFLVQRSRNCEMGTSIQLL